MCSVSVFWLVKRLPDGLKKSFQSKYCKPSGQRLFGLQLITKKDFSSLRLGYADDKNWLAQLTVAQKLNHGVRQWPYIIAGVLFFGSFFCTSKRKNINKKEKLVVSLE